MTHFDLTIRKAKLCDLPMLPQIEDRADSLFPHNHYPDDLDLCSQQDLKQAMNQGFLTVAVIKNELVGFGMASLLGDFLHLLQLSVLPEFGRRGIGAALLDSVNQQAMAAKVSSVTLTTFRDIPWNAPFYEKKGFRVFKDDQLPKDISNILAKEAALGLQNRVAMFCPVPSGKSLKNLSHQF